MNEKEKLNLVCKFYDEDKKKLKERYYVDSDNKKQGLLEVWHRNGQIWIRLNYKKGILDGRYQWWHDNGEVMYDWVFVNGVPKTGE